MPTRDLKNNVASDLAFYGGFTGNTTVTGQTLDAADYDSGIMFSFAAPAWTDGTYTPLIKHSSDNGVLDPFTAVDPDINLIGTYANVTLSSETAIGASMPTLGIVGTKRYVQLEMTSTGVTTGAAVVVITSKVPEIRPVV